MFKFISLPARRSARISVDTKSTSEMLAAGIPVLVDDVIAECKLYLFSLLLLVCVSELIACWHNCRGLSITDSDIEETVRDSWFRQNLGSSARDFNGRNWCIIRKRITFKSFVQVTIARALRVSKQHLKFGSEPFSYFLDKSFLEHRA